LAYEVVVVDDGSTDGSLDVVRPFLDAGVRLVKRRNGGIEAASNVGIAMARADKIVRVDADDYLLPGYLEAIVPLLEDSGSTFAYPDYIVIDGNGDALYEEALPMFNPKEIRSRGDFLATGTMYLKEVVHAFGGYDESTPNCGLENYQLILRLLQAGYKGVHLPGALFAYRRHELNVSSQRKAAIIEYGHQIFSAMGLGPYQTNRFHPYKLQLQDA